MSVFTPPNAKRQKWIKLRSQLAGAKLPVLTLLLLVPLAAHAQGSPFVTGFNALQALKPKKGQEQNHSAIVWDTEQWPIRCGP